MRSYTSGRANGPLAAGKCRRCAMRLSSGKSYWRTPIHTFFALPNFSNFKEPIFFNDRASSLHFSLYNRDFCAFSFPYRPLDFPQDSTSGVRGCYQASRPNSVISRQHSFLLDVLGEIPNRLRHMGDLEVEWEIHRRPPVYNFRPPETAKIETRSTNFAAESFDLFFPSLVVWGFRRIS